MRKPEHQWETREALAVRLAEGPGSELDPDPRAEVFELRFHDGRVGRVACGLSRQIADETAATDPGLAHAVACWLAARGRRTMRLDLGDRPYFRGVIRLEELGSRLPAEARRLVSLCPSNAELLHALGVFARVVACEESSDHPPEVAMLERLGPDLAPDLDRVAELAPDLVVSSLTVPGMERVVTGLRARRVPQIVLAPRSLDDVMEEAIRLGEALGARERGRAVAAELQRGREELRRQRRGPAVRVYLEWWPKPMFTPGADCYSNELIELAGGVNAFRDRAGSSVEIQPDDLLRADPDVCFVSWCGVAPEKLDCENLRRRAGLGDLRASREGRIHPLDEAFSGRPGPRMLEAARIMARAIRELGPGG